MAIDKEQQARLTFLAEAETYFGDIEGVLLELKTATDRPSQIDIAMRAAHSVKGTAAMMGFVELSHTAHHLEDAFKILRARQLPVDMPLETLLLQGVDCLRHIRQHYQDKRLIDPEWLVNEVNPIFGQLNQRLGELTPEDEARLLSEENEVNLDFVIFTTSVDDTLEEFEPQLSQLRGDDLRQLLVNTAKQMMEFGLMAQLESFVSLCESIQAQSLIAQPEALDAISREAIKTWRRCYSLVMLGRTERMPWELPATDLATDFPRADTALEVSDISPETLESVPQEQGSPLPNSLPLDDLASGFDALDEMMPPPLGDEVQSEFTDAVDLEILQGQFASLTSDITKAPATEAISPEISSAAAVSTPVVHEATEENRSAAEIPLVPLSAPPQTVTPNSQNTSTVRVAVEQLRQINSTFESLILNRNAVNLKLEQLQAYSTLMQQRMAALTSFGKELRQWYDQASTEGPAKEGDTGPNIFASNGIMTNGSHNSIATTADLDALEFDRYSQLHLLTQDHMETIVKLEEVSRDIELGLNEIDQAVSGLNYTSRTLKNRITQTQMRPFEEIVGRFPRVVRDWSVQYGKPVTLRLEGETTLIEQFALDQLSDPLMHLLRNAFDHGIESPHERQAHQKPEVGTITLRAIIRGNQVIITLSDDGGGIDLERVRDRIRQYNLPTDQIDDMGRQELLSFIFEPGFSTSDSVTELSGRGFGMDVVRNNLKKLQGNIQVSTESGLGTTFTIRIPLSLSILRVMLLERSGSVFALPVDMVQEIIRSPSTPMEQSSITWNNETIPLVRVEEHWSNQPGARPVEMSGEPVINRPMVVVVGEDNSFYGLSIDRFWREQEVALRSVASPMPLPPGFSGVTVLGDGRVIPVIEPIRLVEWIVAGPGVPIEPTESALAAQSEAARILVVDDSIHARRYLATTLERSGYLVEQAKDGREAVDKLLNGLTVEAVICDIEMPRLDGYGVLEELRDTSEFSELPILMLTSRSSDKHRKLAINLGATGYFSKPYNEQELLRDLKQLISIPKAVIV
ncbi:MAG: hybrid sensor histidine kinase/response regulator [Cyanobacteria bacterium P01_D01_bin.56]